MPQSTVYLVDGTSQLFRAYFAIPGLTNAEGMPTNAVYGFTTMLRKLLKEEKPEYLAVAFDLSGGTFRHDAYAEYKANRPPAPEDLTRQLPYAKQVCEAYRIPVLELAGFEADDLIATLTLQAREAGHEVMVVAADKDLLQLVGDGVQVLNPTKNLKLDPGGVVESFGVKPEQVADVLGLMGDSVDNIPGVPGVGEKTAKSVVALYGGVEPVLTRAGAFVTVYETKDRMLEAMAPFKGADPVAPEAASALGEDGAALDKALDALIELEADEGMGERFAAVRDALQAAGLPASVDGVAGKDAAKAVKELKKLLKGLDPKSSRRIWFALHEHAAAARMSRELAVLRADAPVDFDADAVRMGSPDTEKVATLFGHLGFKNLAEEMEAAVAAGDAPDGGTVGGAAGAAGEAAASESAAAAEQSVRTVLDEAGLEALVADCREAGRLAVSVRIEGSPFQSTLIGVALAPGQGEPAYVPLGHDYLGVPDQLDLGILRKHLAPLMADSSIGKVVHDAKVALHTLRRAEMPLEGIELDTMVAAFLIDSERRGYEPARLAEEFLTRSLTRYQDLAGTGAKQKAAATIEIERMAGFAALETRALLDLAPVMHQRLEDGGLLELYDTIDGPLLPLLAQIEAHGIKVDVERLAVMSSQMEASLDRARKQIHELAGEEFNVDSPKQLREILFEKLGLKSRRKTAKSKVASTDAQTLEDLAEQHEIAGLLLSYRELSKLKGTYVDALPALVNEETGRVHTWYHPTGAATGRLSSSDPNLQNIPVRSEEGRKVRTAFVAEPGNLFLAADYSQIELRVLAHMCDDAGLIEAFRRGEDIHRHTAAQVAGVFPEMVTDEMRRRAKAVNFGLLYGMSEFRLAREQGMSRAEARAFIEAYFDRFSAVRGYIDGVKDQVRRDGAVRTLFGRVRYFPQLRQRVHRGIQEQALRAAVNTTIQGTAADLMKIAMLHVDTALQKAGLPAKILLQVHDELLLEVQEDAVDAVQDLTVEAMSKVHELAVPLDVDVKVGADWEQVT